MARYHRLIAFLEDEAEALIPRIKNFLDAPGSRSTPAAAQAVES